MICKNGICHSLKQINEWYYNDLLNYGDIAVKFGLSSGSGNRIIKELTSNGFVGQSNSERQIYVSKENIKRKFDGSDIHLKIQADFDGGLSLNKLKKKYNLTGNEFEYLNEKYNFKFYNSQAEIDNSLVNEIQEFANRCFGRGDVMDKFGHIPSLNRILKHHVKIAPVLFSIDEVRDKLIELDNAKGLFSNQGSEPMIKFYENLYESILHHTNNHVLYGKKLTERCWRLLNDVEPNFKYCCSICGKSLKFYTFHEGYGGPSKMCVKCAIAGNGLNWSMVSQRMFNSIIEHLSNDDKDRCLYATHGEEKIIYIPLNLDRSKFPNVNKRHMSLDFVLDNKVIEFDGTYWHKTKKDNDADNTKYLESLGYRVLRIPEDEYKNDPTAVVYKCLEFLKGHND